MRAPSILEPRGALFRAALRNGRRPFEADDVAQEVLARVVNARPEFVTHRGYLLAALRNLLADGVAGRTLQAIEDQPEPADPKVMTDLGLTQMFPRLEREFPLAYSVLGRRAEGESCREIQRARGLSGRQLRYCLQICRAVRTEKGHLPRTYCGLGP